MLQIVSLRKTVVQACVHGRSSAIRSNGNAYIGVQILWHKYINKVAVLVLSSGVYAPCGGPIRVPKHRMFVTILYFLHVDRMRD